MNKILNNTVHSNEAENSHSGYARLSDAPFVIGWVSCGITSAVACKLTLERFPNVRLYYMEIDSAHEDNERFINDLEKWYGQKINRIRSKKYRDQFDVIEKTGFVNGPGGARCTLELKKEVRFDLEESFKPDLFEPDKPQCLNQVHGYEFKVEEIQRAIDYILDYGYTNPVFPLIEEKLSKENCAQILIDAGIELPAMYILGYNNNNCIGCVKGGKGYWNKIRIDFPDVFWAMAKLERKVGHSCIKGVFLDELEPEAGRTPKPIIPSCGFVCQVANPETTLSLAKQIFSGEVDIRDVGRRFR